MLETSIKNKLGFITLNHPKKNNALSPALRNALIEALHQMGNDDTVHVIILHSNGKNFCAGADLSNMLDVAQKSLDDNLKDAHHFATLFHQLHSCSKPTIACAQGKIMGGGIGLLAACDIVVSEENAEFCFSEVKLGLVPATITPFVLNKISVQMAKYLMLTAEWFDAKKAKEIGLVDHICDTHAIDLAIRLAQQLLENDQLAIQNIKKKKKFGVFFKRGGGAPNPPPPLVVCFFFFFPIFWKRAGGGSELSVRLCP